MVKAREAFLFSSCANIFLPCCSYFSEVFLQDGYRLALPETCGECRLSREFGDLYKVDFAKLGPEFFNKKPLELVKLVPGGRAKAADMWVVLFVLVVIA